MTLTRWAAMPYRCVDQNGMMMPAKIKEGTANAEKYHSTPSALIHTRSMTGMGARKMSWW